MGARIPALVTPTLLSWAREEAGYSLEEAARRLDTKRSPVSKLREWEAGQSRPTLRQAEKLARIYHRPYSVLCLNEPPRIPPLASEYRRLANVAPGAESPNLRFALRQLIYRRTVALNLYSELGDSTPEFELQFDLSTDTEAAGTTLREALVVTMERQIGWRDEYMAWREWRRAVESLGVLVFQMPKINVTEVRGVSLLEFPLPTIGINSKDAPGSKPFTLIHELVHVCLARAGVEKPAAAEDRTWQAWNTVERFAEAVSAAVLLPRTELAAVVGDQRSWSVDEVRRIARRYKVTPLAMATRLLRLGFCSVTGYRRWKRDWNAYLEKHPPKKGGGIATPAEKALGRNGVPFTSLVLDALSLERITAIQAARYLDLGFPHIESLRQELAMRGTLPTPAGAVE